MVINGATIIGDEVMISSDTIVVTDMPENSVVVGNPEKKSPKWLKTYQLLIFQVSQVLK